MEITASVDVRIRLGNTLGFGFPEKFNNSLIGDLINHGKLGVWFAKYKEFLSGGNLIGKTFRNLLITKKLESNIPEIQK